MPKVSVLIPIYNCEKYLEKCIKSAINQTLKETEEIEKIPDGSEIIIDGGNDHVALQEEN